jgi:hypothetical protein
MRCLKIKTGIQKNQTPTQCTTRGLHWIAVYNRDSDDMRRRTQGPAWCEIASEEEVKSPPPTSITLTSCL